MGLFERLAVDQNGEMPQTLWRPSLVLALHQNRHAPYSRFVQMATVRADGRPANRYGRFPRLLGRDAAIDVRDRLAKPQGRRARPFSLGRSLLVLSRHARAVSDQRPVALVGEDTSDPALARRPAQLLARAGGAGAAQLHLAGAGEPRAERVPFPTDHPDPEKPLPHFCLMMLDPHEVDLLEINGKPQNRWVYKRDDRGRWTGTEVNP